MSYTPMLGQRAAARFYARQAKAARQARMDKKCGKTGINPKYKCTKPVVTRPQESAPPSKVKEPDVNKLKSMVSEYVTVRVPTRRLPKGKDPNEWEDLPDYLYTHEGHRKRTYEANQKMRDVEAQEFSQQIQKVSGNAKVAALVKKHNVKVTSKVLENAEANPAVSPEGKQYVREYREQVIKPGLADGFYLHPDGHLKGVSRNEVYINFRRDKNEVWNPNPAKVTKALEAFSKANEASVKDQEKGRGFNSKTIRNYVQSFTTGAHASGDEQDYILSIHETAHALDIGVGRRIRPKVGDVAEFMKQGRRVAGHYGRSDMSSTGNEFFAETFVLYTAHPAYLKAKAPAVYNWIDTYVDHLLNL